MFITAPPPSQAAIRPTGRTPRPSPGLRMQLSRCLLASLHGPVVVVLVGPRHGAAFREAAFVDADHGYRWLFGVAGCALIVGVKLVHGGGELIESVGQRERVLVCRLAVGSHRPCVSPRAFARVFASDSREPPCMGPRRRLRAAATCSRGTDRVSQPEPPQASHGTVYK